MVWGNYVGYFEHAQALCIPFYFKGRGVKENHIPYKMEIELTYVSIYCTVFYPNVYTFFNSFGNAIALPPYYLEIVLDGWVTCADAMIMYRGSFLQVLLESFYKEPGDSPIYSPLHVMSPIGTNRLLCFCLPWGPCPWGRPVGF